MAPLKRQAPQRVLEDLADEFTLDDAQLLEITQQFLDDFRKGLGDYGHPMAMMYVPVHIASGDTHPIAARPSLPAYPMAQKPGVFLSLYMLIKL
jgi:hypothetical protein